MKKGLLIVVLFVVVALGAYAWDYYQGYEWLTYESPSGYVIQFPDDWDIDISQDSYPTDVIFAAEDPEAEDVLVHVDELTFDATADPAELGDLVDGIIRQYAQTIGYTMAKSEVLPIEGDADALAYFMSGTFANPGGALKTFTHYSVVRMDGKAFVARANYDEEFTPVYVRNLAEDIVRSLEFAD